MKSAIYILLAAVLLAGASATAQERKRRMTPVDNPATTTQAVNETSADTARINAKRREASVSYVDDRGKTIYVDTVTGIEWTDSAAINRVPKMEFPLFHALSVGINIWDPVMRAFGQDYGLADAWVELSLHNRYKPIVEVGLGSASHRSPTDKFFYRSPMSVFFRIGANYNFLFNSNPDYQLFAGARYGFAPFSYSIDDVVVDSPYWDESVKFNIPSQNATAGWFELILGLRVKLWGPISAGWTFKYHQILHQSHGRYGDPWYIPGYGSRKGALTGSFSIVYTLPLSHLNKPKAPAVIDNKTEVKQSGQ